MSHHITSKSIDESVKGWIKVLDDDVKALFEERMTGALEVFGYPVYV